MKTAPSSPASPNPPTRIAALVLAAMALAACGAAPEDRTYEADAEDVSGGELIVSEQGTDAVPVELPETPMTPVPPATEDDAAEVEEPGAAGAAEEPGE